MPMPVADQDLPAPRRSGEPWFIAVEVLLRQSAARPGFAAGERLDAPGVAQLEAAQQRGLRTAVLTRDRTCYGEELDGLVDHWVDCDSLDADAVLAALRTLDGRIAAVASSVDGFTAPAAVAARALGLRGPTPGSPVLADDRRTLHAALAAAGVRDVGWAELAAGARPTSPIGYPCVVQPVDGGSGWDVALVSDDRELREVVGRHLARPGYSRGLRPRHRLVVEEYVPGPRYGADGFVGADGPVVLAWSEIVTTPPPHLADLVRTATTRAPDDDAAAWVRTWLAAVGHDFGPFHLEFVLGPDGPRLAVLNPTLAGGGRSSCVDLVSGVPSADAAVGQLLGEPPVEPTAAVTASTQLHLSAQLAGRLRAVTGFPEVGAIPGLVVAEVFADLGEAAGPVGRGRERLGHVVTVGDSPEQARRRAVAAIDGIRLVVDEPAPVPLPRRRGSSACQGGSFRSALTRHRGSGPRIR